MYILLRFTWVVLDMFAYTLKFHDIGTSAKVAHGRREAASQDKNSA